MVVELPRPVRNPGRRGQAVVGQGLLRPTHSPVDDHQDEEEVSTGTGTRSNSDAESNRIKGIQKHFDERLNRAIGGL